MGFSRSGLLFPSPKETIERKKVKLLSHVRLFVTPWTAPHQASLSITSSRSLLTHVHHVGDAIPPPHPLSSIFPPTYTFPSFKVFSSESVLRIRWPKCWRFSFSISPSSEYSGLTSFATDWFDLLCSSRDSQESSPTSHFKHAG